ncbi:TPA: hypothetical protein DEO28_01900 [Candidatus Dependentiae bacterium]|nr:MAG: hypothetical protein UR14_C0004G0065 [candidate division TM6 bacterium GW2011_GWE2_31_21]KKP52984.1 MAG: hypothetical protein UR43_C0008G0066 [candidate division TM6 bacterium GW2011_GWF2_33_332]HBS47778.1 hypothetical protein [Candidatus Dependentiae bacterium]HBZ73246.1 hypothetical protein [Candidatus Dependentiae bacterium]
MKQNRKLLITILAVGLTTSAAAIDNAHFYKAAHLHRSSTTSVFDKVENYENYNWFTKLDLSYAYGDARSSWDKNGHTGSLLNRVGTHNMLYLFENVTKLSTFQYYADFFSMAVANHAGTNDNFGQLDFHGKFRIHDVNIDLRQNLVSKFFVNLQVPVRSVSVRSISYTDLSPDNGIYSKTTHEWIQFKNQLNTILNTYGYNSYGSKYEKTSFGDVSLLLGWEGDFKTEGKDPIKFNLTAKAGVLFPTGVKEKTNYVFSVPTGYNGHWAIPLFVQFDMIPNDWLTIDGQASAAFFFDKTMNKRMKTFSKQQSDIRLAQGNAKEEKGTLWHLGTDIKFDHILKGLSALVGYSYNKQEKDTLTPKDSSLFDHSAVNSDSLIKGFTMHVIHFMVDYDFSVHMSDSKWAPRLNVFYNYPFDGKNAFKTDMIGAGLGMDIRWKF